MQSSRPGSKPPKPTPSANPGSRPAPARSVGTDPTGSVIDPAWLLKAVFGSIGVALLCGYVTFCLLFYQGQWQLVLHPTRNQTVPAWAGTLPPGSSPQEVHFGPDASGTPQLTGWWLPASPAGQYRHLTVLYLPSGDGQLATSAQLLEPLQQLGLNVFAFDYRGYGQSAPGHPAENSMTDDARSALSYLNSIRGVPHGRTILYGVGVGGSLAVTLAQANPDIPVIILDAPRPDLLSTALADPRARTLPVRLLFKERFPLFPALASLRTPKLIVTRITNPTTQAPATELTAASDPKFNVILPQPTPPGLLAHALSRFLDQYAPPTPAPLITPASPGTATPPTPASR